MSWTENELQKKISAIEEPFEEAMEKARVRQAMLAKPPGSLGELERLSVQLAGITGSVYNSMDRQCVLIFSADNGVVEEGVASAPQSVTMAQTVNFLRGKTGVGALARHFGVDLLVVDVGINGSLPGELCSEQIVFGRVVDRKVAFGTRNLAMEPAMERQQVLQAMGTGIEMMEVLHRKGYNVVGIGEMGIGNTTTSAVVLSALLGLPAAVTVGRGGGLTDSAFQKKRELVDSVLERWGWRREREDTGSRWKTPDVLEVLEKAGGLDIAAMAGAFLGAALYRIPVVIDGGISAAAAVAASLLEIQRKGRGLLCHYLIPSHFSMEACYKPAMEALGLNPGLNLSMRLGEGSGCPLMFKILEAACAVMNGMATFEEAAIDDGYLEEIRKGDCF